MYGLILQNMVEYIQNKHGDNMWKKVKEQLNLEVDAFPASDTFPEAQVGKMGKTAMKILSMKDEEFYEGMGKYFVTLAKDAGYERTILQLGRGLRDFFLNLDNLHDYLKYTFPKMKAPSFFVDSETEENLMLQYRTRRRGFHYYVQGQVKEIAKLLFINAGEVTNKLEAKLKKQEIVFDTAVFHFELQFSNVGYTQHLKAAESRKEASMPIRAGIFFEMFPFCLLYEKDMIVKNMGSALRFCIPQMIGQKLGNFWELMKPLVDFKYEVIETRMNSMFELATQEEIDKLRSASATGETSEKSSEELELDDLEDIDKTLHIKGQMIYIAEWQQMLFLACPIMKGLNNLIWSGLFINDLSMHDYSRDIMLANAQTEMEATMAKMELAKIDNVTRQNNNKSNNLKKENDNLGFMFLPSVVISEMSGGKKPEEISSKVERNILLSAEILGAPEFCAKSKPADIVNFFNNVESIWDHLVKKNKCFKLDSIVEYVAEAGATDKGSTVENIASLALDIIEATKKAVRCPATKKPVKYAIAITGGPVVTGIAGLKVPKFSCFGQPLINNQLVREACPDDTCLVGPGAKGLLPGMYKLKDFKDLPGVGMTHKLEDCEGRKPLSDKDILTKEPIEAAPKDAAKADGKEGDKAAPAAASGGGDAGGEGKGDAEGNAGGGSEEGGEAPAGQEDAGEGVAARPVSVTNQAQCCGALKSGVCNLI